jgi:hypothetical protein
MDVVEGVIVSIQPIHEAVLPPCSRDQAGELGEKMFMLAEALEVLPEKVLLKPATPGEVWTVIQCVLGDMQASERLRFMRNHLGALRTLQRYAEQ